MSRNRKKRRDQLRPDNEQIHAEIVDMGQGPKGMVRRISVRFDGEGGPMFKSFSEMAEVFSKGKKLND